MEQLTGALFIDRRETGRFSEWEREWESELVERCSQLYVDLEPTASCQGVIPQGAGIDNERPFPKTYGRVENPRAQGPLETNMPISTGTTHPRLMTTKLARGDGTHK